MKLGLRKRDSETEDVVRRSRGVFDPPRGRVDRLFDGEVPFRDAGRGTGDDGEERQEGGKRQDHPKGGCEHGERCR